MAREKFKQQSSKAKFLRDDSQAKTDLSIDDLPPAFSFEKMQDASGNSFNCCEDGDRLQLAKRLFMLSRMPWREIHQAPSKGLGSERIPRFRIKRAIPDSVTEDVDMFNSLHYSGRKRFLGYRVGQIFYVLWIDHNFSVYNHD